MTAGKTPGMAQEAIAAERRSTLRDDTALSRRALVRLSRRDRNTHLAACLGVGYKSQVGNGRLDQLLNIVSEAAAPETIAELILGVSAPDSSARSDQVMSFLHRYRPQGPPQRSISARPDIHEAADHGGATR